MTSCATNTCGVGGWGGPLPGDPDNSSVLTATPAFGGNDVSWTYPTTNPQAVAYAILYRGNQSNFSSAIQIAKVGGNFFYDKSTIPQLTQYYYWITFVSVNGTVGAAIGPASAIAKPPIASVLEGLTAKIDAGMLDQALKGDIDKIAINATDIQSEVNNRIAANTAFSNALVQVQNGVEDSLAYIATEITQRQEGDSALVSQVNLIAAANADNLALIQEESEARVTADSANAELYTTLNSQVNHATTGLPATRATLLNDYLTSAQTTSAISSAITTSQSTLNDNIASAQTTLQTNINTVNNKVTNIGALYTAKLSVNGLIGGFGIYNDGTTVEAGFDVDNFWVGKTQANKRKPFIISGGVTYIDDAAIQKLTFSKLRDESGSFIVEGGKVKADYLNVTSITGGTFSGYAWPVAGEKGFYLGPSGFLLGNYNGGGSYLQYDIATGSLQVGGNATFSGTLTANIVKTTNIAVSAVTTGYSASTAGSSVDIVISIPSGSSGVLIAAYLGSLYTYIEGTGKNSFEHTALPQGILKLDGVTQTVQSGTMIWNLTALSAGTYTVSLLRNVNSGTMNISVSIFKR